MAERIFFSPRRGGRRREASYATHREGARVARDGPRWSRRLGQELERVRVCVLTRTLAGVPPETGKTWSRHDMRVLNRARRWCQNTRMGEMLGRRLLQTRFEGPHHEALLAVLLA